MGMDEKKSSSLPEGTANKGYFGLLSLCKPIVMGVEEKSFFLRPALLLLRGVGNRKNCICPITPIFPAFFQIKCAVRGIGICFFTPCPGMLLPQQRDLTNCGFREKMSIIVKAEKNV